MFLRGVCKALARQLGLQWWIEITSRKRRLHLTEGSASAEAQPGEVRHMEFSLPLWVRQVAPQWTLWLSLFGGPKWRGERYTKGKVKWGPYKVFYEGLLPARACSWKPYSTPPLLENHCLHVGGYIPKLNHKGILWGYLDHSRAKESFW